MLLVSTFAMATISVVEDLANYTWTGTDTDANLQYVLSAIDGNPDNGFKIALGAIDASGITPYVSSTLLASTDFWEPYFYNRTLSLLGEGYQCYDNVKEIEVTNVTLTEALFNDYAELKKVTLNYDIDVAIPDRCFGHAERLFKDGLYINFSGSTFTLGTDAFNYAQFPLYTNSEVVHQAFQDGSYNFDYYFTGQRIVVTSDPTNYTWTGVDATDNMQYVLGAINGNPENGFSLTVSRLNAAQSASIDDDLMYDQNFWTSIYYQGVYEAIGEYHNLSDDLKRLTVTDVTLNSGLFGYYGNLKNVVLNYSYDVTLPYSLFEGCTGLDTVTVNFSGSNLSLDWNALETNTDYVVKTGDWVAYKVLKQYKNNYSAQYTILFTGEIPQSDYYLIVSGLSAEEQAQWRFAESEDEDDVYVLDLGVKGLAFPSNSTYYVGTLDGTLRLGTTSQDYSPWMGNWEGLTSLDEGGYAFLAPSYVVGKITYRPGDNVLILDQQACAKPTVEFVDGKLRFSCDTPGVTYYYNVSCGNGGETTETEVELSSYTFNVSVQAYKADGSLAWSDPTEAQFTITPGGQDGDLNNDGEVNVADVTRLVNKILSNP